jgi:hypothetical protein
MEEQLDQTLENARLLIQAERKPEARLLLMAYLERNSNSAHAWFLLSQAVDEPGQEIACLERALKNDPLHTEARLRLVQLQSTPPHEFSVTSLMDMVVKPEIEDAASSRLVSDAGENRPGQEPFDLFAPGAFDRQAQEVEKLPPSMETIPEPVPQAQPSEMPVSTGATSTLDAAQVPVLPATQIPVDQKKEKRKKEPKRERMSVIEIILLIILVILILVVVGYVALSGLGLN